MGCPDRYENPACTRGPLSFQTDFEAAAELCLVITEMDEGLRPALRAVGRRRISPAAKHFLTGLHEPNVCLLNFVDYQINDEPPVCGKDILEADKEIRTVPGTPTARGADAAALVYG